MYKKQTAQAFFLAIILCFQSNFTVAATSIFIQTFEDQTDYDCAEWNLGEQFAEKLAEEIEEGTNLAVFERTNVTATANTEEQKMSTATIHATITNSNDLLEGADYLLHGTITEFSVNTKADSLTKIRTEKKTYTASARVSIVDLHSGRTIFKGSSKGRSSSLDIRIFSFGGKEKNVRKYESAAVHDAMKSMAKKIAGAELDTLRASNGQYYNRAVPLPGAILIAEIDGNSVILNKGKTILRTGEKHTVERQISTVQDPRNGKLVTTKTVKVGEIQVIRVEDTYAEGLIILGSKLRIGDNVLPASIQK